MQRGAGHLDLCSPRAAESVKSGLLRALAVENALIFDHSDPTVELGEGDGDFQAELIGCVASLHDPRGAHELASALDTGGGAVNGLLGLGGDVAANKIVAILASPKKRIELRMDAAELAGRQTAPSTRTPVSAENRARLRTVLLASLADHSGEIRSARSSAYTRSSTMRFGPRSYVLRNRTPAQSPRPARASMAPHQLRENGSSSTAPLSLGFRHRCNACLNATALSGCAFSQICRTFSLNSVAPESFPFRWAVRGGMSNPDHRRPEEDAQDVGSACGSGVVARRAEAPRDLGAVSRLAPHDRARRAESGDSE